MSTVQGPRFRDGWESIDFPDQRHGIVGAPDTQDHGKSQSRANMFELPPEIAGPSAWYGPDFADRADWIVHLSPDELSEIEIASQRLERSEIDWQALQRDGFPLPTMQRRLSHVLDEVLEGRGFVLLRGLPVARWGQRLSAIAFLGLGLHWGSLRSQNKHGHLLGHVRDAGLSSQDPNVRVYQTHERQNYHTDSCDVVGLLCLHPAKSGGLSSLVSSVTIFNEMRKRRSDLAQVLFEPSSRPTGEEKCLRAKDRFSVFRFSIGMRACCRPSIIARILNRRGGFLRYRHSRRSKSRRSICSSAWQTTLRFIYKWSYGLAIFSSCTITRCFTTERPSRIGRSRSESGTCCDSGWPRRGLGHFLRCSRNATARSFLAGAAGSLFPERDTRSRGGRGIDRCETKSGALATRGRHRLIPRDPAPTSTLPGSTGGLVPPSDVRTRAPGRSRRRCTRPFS